MRTPSMRLIDFRDELSHRFALDSKLEVWRVSDPTSLPRGGLARTLSPILYGSGELAGSERLTRRTTLRVGYRFEGVKIYDPDPAFYKPPGYAHTPFAELWYRLTRRTDIGVEYRFQYLTFGTQSSDANSIAATYRYQISPDMKMTVKLGPTFYQKLESDPFDRSRTGWLPRFIFDLTRDAKGSRIGLLLAHELAGASGFTLPRLQHRRRSQPVSKWASRPRRSGFVVLEPDREGLLGDCRVGMAGDARVFVDRSLHEIVPIGNNRWRRRAEP